MKAVLHVASGALEGRRVVLRPGAPLRVGRGARADLVIARDEKMAAVHFELTWDGAACRLRDVSRAGTQLDGRPVTEGVARNGAWIVAGETGFLLRVRADDLRKGLPPAPKRSRSPSPSLLAARAEALRVLAAEAGLFAILDAARDPRVKALVDACEDESRSLFDGQRGAALAEAAPYLVRFEAGAELLEVVVSEGWGDAWGVFLTSARPFDEVRRRLRRSLMVTDDETGRRLYFRFYDPRVLRAFWPAATPRQRTEILGTEIGGFIVEGDGAALLRLGLASEGDGLDAEGGEAC
ncbi:MAG: DUF4123 domain-containing protein [Minicystis sp.]